jgi:hypothetical protein
MANELVFQQRVIASDGTTRADYLSSNLQKLNWILVEPEILEAGTTAALTKAKAANFSPDESVANEIIAFHNAVVKDGRYVTTALTDPTGTAAKLGLGLSPAAELAITTASRFVGPTPDCPVVFVICVAVIVVVAKMSVPRTVIIDESGLVKL